MDARAVRTTDEITNTKRYILVARDVKLAELLAVVRTAHGLAVEAPWSLSYVYEDGNIIQITADDLIAALAQIRAGEIFRVFVRIRVNIGINAPQVLTVHNAFDRKNEDKYQQIQARKAEKVNRKLESKKVVKKNLKGKLKT
ncbi:MAG: hypothetical protein EZS28_021994 [Streblomastix strix]|uniref:PB1 domain-containing protein n=1 Tax=Streblomastix strix TaxID=222440 RepID=A0A5J4VJB9_9EUKA|nr:MAG: hypothetical protein EZS28_021994 [Streblomastix strix]